MLGVENNSVKNTIMLIEIMKISRVISVENFKK